MGADIRFVAPGEDRAGAAERVIEEVKEMGQNPYVVSVGGSHVGYSMTKPLGAISYTKAFLEIVDEAQKQKIKPTHIVHATGSGGTQGGLCAGARAVDPRVKFDEYVGEGYGVLNRKTVDAILVLARKEGILLDPVYTGKAMSGLIDLIKKGYFKKSDNVVFIHTGGTPALFPYGKELLEYLQKGDVAYYKAFYRLS